MKYRQLTFLGFGFGLLAMAGIVISQLASRQNHVFAQDQETLNIMERIEKLAEATGSYHAEFMSTMEENGKTFLIQGKIKFKWPNMHWQENRHSTKRGVRIGFIISNGKIRWNYMPSLKFAYKHDLKALDEDARQKGWGTAGYFEEDSMKYLGREQLGKEEVYIFEGQQSVLMAPRNSKQPGKARVYFSVNDGIPRKVVEHDHQGREIGSQTFFNIRKDASISAKEFEFTPPEGTRIYEVKDVGSRINPQMIEE